MSKPLPSIPVNQIPIVASSDDNYAAPLDIMFISLLENTSAPERIHFFVIDGGITENRKTLLQKDVEERKSRVTFLNVNDNIYANFPTRAHISAPAYYRISIPELFSETVNRVIYLDCDLIIKQDIQNLWDIDTKNHPIAAVENVSSSTYKASKLKQSDYFNSGVMIINLIEWRKGNIPKKVREFKLNHPELICTNDQCALNGVFKGDWFRLPLYWNHQSGLYRKSPQVERLIYKESSEDALWDPAIIHYIGWSKPWIEPCYHPLEGEYRRYKKLSSYATVTIKDKNTESTHKRFFFSLLKKRLRQYLWQWRYKKRGIELFQ
ncbi:MAG: glycosyltransferase family 8 protein [Cellvibrionaceae bacterium]